MSSRLSMTQYDHVHFFVTGSSSHSNGHYSAVQKCERMLILQACTANGLKFTSVVHLTASVTWFTVRTPACALACVTRSIPPKDLLISRLQGVETHKSCKVMALSFCKDMV